MLFEMHTVEDTATHFGTSISLASERLDRSIKALQLVRSRRPRPLSDDKVVTAWNGLMIGALAHASRVFDDSRYLASAEVTARFLRSHLFDPQSKRLRRSYRAGIGSVDGFLDDYSGLINGLLELYEADFDIEWLQWAVTLQQTQDEVFWDSQKGGYFDVGTGDSSLLARTREAYDGAVPSPNSTAAMNLLRLAQITGRDDWRERGEKTVASFSALLASDAEPSRHGFCSGFRSRSQAAGSDCGRSRCCRHASAAAVGERTFSSQ